MKRFGLYLGAVCFALGSAGTPAFAARPFVTDDSGTVEAGTFELETAWDYWKARAAASLSFKHGVTERMDIGVGIGYVSAPQEERAFDTADLGLKFALIPDLFSASFSAGFASQTYSLNAILSKSFGPLTCDANLGYEAITDTDDAELTFGLAGVYNHGRLGVGVEIGGTHEGLSWWQVGARFQIREWLQIDAGLGGDSATDPDLTATTGLWFGFPLFAGPGKGE
jgi:hypothetical protein